MAQSPQPLDGLDSLVRWAGEPVGEVRPSGVLAEPHSLHDLLDHGAILAYGWVDPQRDARRPHGPRSASLAILELHSRIDGHEVDLLIDRGTSLVPIEIRATATPRPELAKGLRKLRDLGARDPDVEVSPGIVVYGGREERPAGEDRLVPWTDLDAIVDRIR
jgi:hypothetical protein